jgi:hypothetical protein
MVNNNDQFNFDFDIDENLFKTDVGKTYGSSQNQNFVNQGFGLGDLANLNTNPLNLPDYDGFKFWGKGGVDEFGRYRATGMEHLGGYQDPLTKMKHGSWAGGAFDALEGGAKVYLGLKKLGLAEDSFNFQKQAFNKNYAAQKQLVEADFNWRENARKLANASYQKKTINI